VQHLLARLDDGQLDQAMRCWPTPSACNDEQGREKRIALIGLRGAGKSTLGASWPPQRGVPFVELDREIEREAGTSMNEILLLHGQAGYRRYERRALMRIAEDHADGVVVTTGGSIVSERETFDLLQSRFWCVWVKASPEEHMSRVVAQGDMRPFDTTRGATNEAMEDLRRILASRESLYARADAVVDTAARTVKQSMKDLERAVPALRQPESQGDCLMNAMTEPLLFTQGDRELVRFATHPSKYRHWQLSVEGDVARLKLDIDEDGGIKPGYKLKLNSYDLGVDIELHDAVNRIRFEHPA
jgi:shikimate kinase